MDKKVEQARQMEKPDEHPNCHDKKRFLRMRREVIKTMIFATILGYSCGGSNIYYELKYQPYRRLKHMRAKISSEPPPKMIASAQGDAIGKLFGYGRRGGVRFDAFNKAYDDCMQNSECSVSTFPAKEILNPEEYSLNTSGYCAEFDGHDYYFGEFSTADGSALVIAFRIIETDGFLNEEKKYIAKPFLVGGAKAEEDKTMNELEIKARNNAQKNLHDSYMSEYGPRLLIIDNGLGGDQRIFHSNKTGK